MDPDWRTKCAAEAIGTFALVFVGAGSILATRGLDLVAIALAHGLTLAIMVTATGPISGGHINPAVTLGALVAKRIPRDLAVAYIVAQLVGALFGAAFLAAAFQTPASDPLHLGTPALGSYRTNEVGVLQGIFVEFVLTFLLVFVVFATAIDRRGLFPAVGGFAIGLTIAADIFVGGGLTGAAMNPARAFGPALVSGFWNDHLVYWVGPILGGLAVGFVYPAVFLPKPRPPQLVPMPPPQV